MPEPAPLSLRELVAIAAHAPETASPLAPPHHLVVALQAGDEAVATLPQATAAVCRLPCPVIALAPEAHPLAAAFDVRLDDGSGLPLLARHIAHAPLAASVLVQVLRHTEHLAIEQALFVESLAYASLQAGPEFQRWCALPRPEVPATAAGEWPPVIVERTDDEPHRLSIQLNRPSRRNALSVELRDALVEALQLVAADASITHVDFQGNGSCFSIGGDVSEFGQLPDPASAHAIRLLRSPAQALARCLDRRLAFHLHSACIGAGIELPAFGHRVVAAPGTFFQLPELRFGLIPGAGGCVSIPRRIGRQRMAWMALSMKRIPSAMALAWGLVDEVVPLSPGCVTLA